MSTKITQSSQKSPKLNSMAKEQLAAFSYVLYLYREELRKPRQSWMNKARSKFLLTHELVNKTTRNMNACSHDDLMALAREKEFKNQLYRQITRTKYQNNMRTIQNGKQQNAKVMTQQQKLIQYQQQQKFQQQFQQQPQQRQMQPLQQYVLQQQYLPPPKYQHQLQFQQQQQFQIQQQQYQLQQYQQQQYQQQQFHQQQFQQQQFQQQAYYHQQAKRPCFNDYRTSSSSWKYS